MSTTSEKQVWLITGGSRGLGFLIAKLALAAGHNVVACYRDKSKIASNAAEIEKLGGSWLQLDVAGDDVEAKVQSVVEKYGKVDVLINNAAYAIAGAIEETNMEAVERIFKTNVFGTLRTLQAVLPSMRARKTGTIVNITSSSGLRALPAIGLYSSTKFAVEGLTEALQMELASFGIRVLLVEPGAMATEFADPNGSSVALPISDAYRGSAVQQVADLLGSEQYAAFQANPVPFAERIVETIDGTGMMAGREVALRLPLGKDVGKDLEQRIALYQDLGVNLKDVRESC